MNMKHIFITYGDQRFAKTKQRILEEARNLGIFDEVYAYGPEDVSEEVAATEAFKIPRGGGMWMWKPDVILSTMFAHADGDIIVFCDAGCTLSSSSEWSRYWKKLSKSDIIAQRLIQRTDRWTRKELLSLFPEMGDRWLKDYQYLTGTIIFKNSPFSRKFVSEWREIMIHHPECVVDVPSDERHLQHPTFIESRHDQSVFSALIYKYLSHPETRDLVYTQWEHIEFYDIFCKQAIRATRLRTGEKEPFKEKILGVRRSLGKNFILIPFYHAPLHWWYSFL